MIWRSTQKLGCATARNNKCNMKDYYVCRYSPVSFVVCTICHRFHCVCKFINKMAGLDAVFKLYRGSRTQRGRPIKSIHNCFAGRQCQSQIFFPWQRQSAIMPIYAKIELIILVAIFKLIHSQLTYYLLNILPSLHFVKHLAIDNSDSNVSASDSGDLILRAYFPLYIMNIQIHAGRARSFF